jgi:hypothetical protein
VDWVFFGYPKLVEPVFQSLLNVGMHGLGFFVVLRKMVKTGFEATELKLEEGLHQSFP